MEMLSEQIKLNCNISDAKYWGYYSICGLLMRYRELYRSERSIRGPLKKIADEKNVSLLNFYMAFLHGFRKELFPEIRSAFQQFAESQDWSQDWSRVRQARETGWRRAEGLRSGILEMWEEDRDPSKLASAIKDRLPSVAAKTGLQ